MKTAHGHWLADSDSRVLRYQNGRVLRVFGFPPGVSSTAAEALSWISRTDMAAGFSDQDLLDLGLAVKDAFGR